jgi:hypothetical protein
MWDKVSMRSGRSAPEDAAATVDGRMGRGNAPAQLVRSVD